MRWLNIGIQLNWVEMKNIILVSGKSRSGKDTFTNLLAEELTNRNLSFHIDYFARSIKEWSYEDFKPIIEYINSIVKHSDDKIKNKLYLCEDNFFENKTDLSRLILQIYGTNIFRNRVNENWWINITKEIANNSEKDFFIIKDVRFPNEIGMFYDLRANIIPIRIERRVKTPKKIANHISETALDDFEQWNYIVDNNQKMSCLKDSTLIILDDILKMFS